MKDSTDKASNKEDSLGEEKAISKCVGKGRFGEWASLTFHVNDHLRVCRCTLGFYRIVKEMAIYVLVSDLATPTQAKSLSVVPHSITLHMRLNILGSHGHLNYIYQVRVTF